MYRRILWKIICDAFRSGQEGDIRGQGERGKGQEILKKQVLFVTSMLIASKSFLDALI